MSGLVAVACAVAPVADAQQPVQGLPLFECVFSGEPFAAEGPISYRYDEARNVAFVNRRAMQPTNPIPVLILSSRRSITFVNDWSNGTEILTVITAGQDFGVASITRQFVYAYENTPMAVSVARGRCTYSGQARVPSRSSGIN